MSALLSLIKVTCVGQIGEASEEDDELDELASSLLFLWAGQCRCKTTRVIKRLADNKPVASARRELSMPKHGPFAQEILSPAVVARDQPKDIHTSLPDPLETMRRGIPEVNISNVSEKSDSNCTDLRSWCCHGTR